ncbi:isoprenoid biosynthesis-like protein [Heliocybe sulcata]|uniref:(2E,6E)-farnesyl diphosphate synthase n=1 Tax=Heliocybe sulcata TaxID=5364 RepID=A0A5C3N6D6_9AGAM|nr:isoprenoid biosynthesis-like protein [Heliocybe sulcata]
MTSGSMSSNHRRFQEAWPILRDDVLEDWAAKGVSQDAIDWCRRNMEYNVIGGKMLRGRAVVDSLAILEARELTDEECFRAAVLGWCMELFQAFGLVADDIMDQSPTRRGRPCWYKVEDVGLVAINDAFILEGTMFFLLKKYFRDQEGYVDFVELFREMIYLTEMGQLLDTLPSSGHRVIDLETFSMERYRLTAIYKSAYFSIYLPIALAMLLNGIPRQVQDDFIDFAGLPEHTGKVGTDIVNNKCTWCVITAFAHADAGQREVLRQKYGRQDGASEEKVREVFEQVGLRERYVAYEEEVYQRINGMVERIPKGEDQGAPVVNGEVFTVFLEKLYKRSK